MATTVVLTSVVKAVSGKVYINFAGGTQLEFTTIEEVRAWARQPDTSVETTQQLCVAWAVARSETLSNIATVQNKNFIFDLSAAQPIKVQ